MVGEGDLLARHLVDGGGQALRQPPRVHEDHRRAVRPDQLDEPGMDRRPDRASPALSPLGGRRLHSPDPAEVLDRDLDSQVELLLAAGIDDLDRPRPPLPAGRRQLAPTEEPGHFVERSLCRRKPDALERRFRRAQGLDPFQRKEQMRAALSGDERVDLVDDDRVDRAEDLARLRGEQEVERLRRGDEDVGRSAQHLRAFLGGRVAGADSNHRHVDLFAVPLCLRRDACDRGPEVALDIDSKRLHRRDVEHPAARFLFWRRIEHQAVNRRQKGCESLPGSRRREEQGAPSRQDGRPTERLCAGRGGERRLEPAAHDRP